MIFYCGTPVLICRNISKYQRGHSINKFKKSSKCFSKQFKSLSFQCSVRFEIQSAGKLYQHDAYAAGCLTQPSVGMEMDVTPMKPYYFSYRSLRDDSVDGTPAGADTLQGSQRSFPLRHYRNST